MRSSDIAKTPDQYIQHCLIRSLADIGIKLCAPAGYVRAQASATNGSGGQRGKECKRAKGGTGLIRKGLGKQITRTTNTLEWLAEKAMPTAAVLYEQFCTNVHNNRMRSATIST